MQATIREKISAVNERALKRRVSFPSQKSEKDARLENEIFDEMKEKMYEQIAKA